MTKPPTIIFPLHSEGIKYLDRKSIDYSCSLGTFKTISQSSGKKQSLFPIVQSLISVWEQHLEMFQTQTASASHTLLNSNHSKTQLDICRKNITSAIITFKPICHISSILHQAIRSCCGRSRNFTSCLVKHVLHIFLRHCQQCYEEKLT